LPTIAAASRRGLANTEPTELHQVWEAWKDGDHDRRHAGVDVHVLACPDQPDRDRLWLRRFVTTAATSVTGSADHLLPSHKVGIVSVGVLALAILARYGFHLAGAWRRIYVVSTALALYLNVSSRWCRPS